MTGIGSPRRPRAAILALGLVVAGLAPARVGAQLLHLDPIPFPASADSTSRLALVVAADRFSDPRFDWSVNRLLLTVILPGGEDGIFFVRMPHLTFDSGAESAASRWPGILGEETQPDWPGSGRIKSFGQLEAGASSPLSLPGLGALRFGAALGLPVGVDRLFPFSSTSLPLRLELAKTLTLTGPLSLNLAAGFLLNMNSGKAELASEAFPSGRRLGVGLAWYRGRGGRLLATADLHDRGGRVSRLAGLQWWLPWTQDGSLGLKVAKELEDGSDRAASWYATVAWRFDSPRYRPGADPQDPGR